MRTVGMLTTTALGLLALLVATLVVRSVPDVQRYLRIRAM
jgi:hypothetical protein